MWIMKVEKDGEIIEIPFGVDMDNDEFVELMEKGELRFRYHDTNYILRQINGAKFIGMEEEIND